MTDTELYEIVKGHREAWPEDVRMDTRESGEPYFVLWGASFPYAELMFEASFHRMLLANTDYVFATRHDDGKRYTVQICDTDFEAASLIEAYVMALDWLK